MMTLQTLYHFLTLNCLPYTETVPILPLARHTENHTKPDETLEACLNQFCEKKVNCVGGEKRCNNEML